MSASPGRSSSTLLASLSSAATQSRLASPVGRPVAASATQPAAAARAAETNLSEPPDAASSMVPSASHVESVGLSFDTM